MSKRCQKKNKLKKLEKHKLKETYTLSSYKSRIISHLKLIVSSVYILDTQLFNDTILTCEVVTMTKDNISYLEYCIVLY